MDWNACALLVLIRSRIPQSPSFWQIASDDSKPSLSRAYRLASRKAFLWEEEATCLHQKGRSLTELQDVGQHLEKVIRGWIGASAIVPSPPPVRPKFFTLTGVRSILQGNSAAIPILGHPRGRIYKFREGLSADWPRVFAVAAELDKAVEIDSYPDRQDLSLDLFRLAAKAGCRISIGTDAHGTT